VYLLVRVLYTAHTKQRFYGFSDGLLKPRGRVFTARYEMFLKGVVFRASRTNER